jgi:hypothetical protein
MPVLDTISSVRAVQAQFRVNGIAVPFESIDVESNNYFAADTFSAVLPLAAMPPGFALDFWGNTASAECEVLIGVGLPAQTVPLTSLIIGLADAVDVDLTENTLRVHGRDYSSLFIDSTISQHFPNLPSSEIAKQIVANHAAFGISGNIAATETQAGKLYEINKVKLGSANTPEASEWGLLAYLARFENFDLLMSGKVLNFQPKADGTANPYELRFSPATSRQIATSNVGSIRISRNLTLAREIVVNAISFNAKMGTGFQVTATAQTNSSGQAGAVAAPRTYTFVHALEDQAALTRFATQQAEQIARHERTLTYEGPGHLEITPRTLLKLVGSGSGYDQDYYIDQIDRRISLEDGFTMTVHAKNHAITAEVAP